MKNNLKSYFLIIVWSVIPQISADQLIIMFLKPYPSAVLPQPKVKKSQKKSSLIPERITTDLSQQPIASVPVGGIFATYGGYLTVSDPLGEITFPRRITKPLLYIIITEQLTPIVMTGNTIHHWELQENTPTQMYKYEQKLDPQTGVHFWEVTAEPLPADNRIPLESIALIANPKYVFVPLGISLFKESPHLILPDIYIKNGINLTADALFILNLAQYFGPIIPLYKKDNMRYSRQLTY